MIIGSSNHPVEVKKISIEAWTLKEELKSIISEKLNDIKEKGEGKINLQEIRALYAPNDVDAAMGEVKEDEEKKEEEEKVEAKEGEEEKVEVKEGEEEKVEAKEGEEKKEEVKEGEEEKVEAKEGEEKKEEEKKEEPLKDKKKKSPFREKPALLPEESVVSGVLFLADVNMDEILFFSKSDFMAGQTIAINFLVPNSFIVSSEVMSCIQHNTRSRIISDSRPPYRVRAKFNFLTKGERTLLRNFLKSVQPDLPKAAARPAKTEPKDDLDDLENLDL